MFDASYQWCPYSGDAIFDCLFHGSTQEPKFAPPRNPSPYIHNDVMIFPSREVTKLTGHAGTLPYKTIVLAVCTHN